MPHARGVTGDRLLPLLFKHRSAIPLLLTAPVALCALRGGSVAAPAALLGAACVTAGVGLRLLSVRRIGRGARVHRPHASAGLVSQGPYRWSRNPLYLAAALILCGLGLLAGLGAWAVLLLAATLLLYTPIVRSEERALAALLGAGFRDYLASVPRWLGRPRPRDPQEPEVLVPWSEVFRRERWLVPGCALAAVGVALLRSGRLPLDRVLEPIGRALGLDPWQLLAVGFAVALVANALAIERHQRRRRRRRVAMPSR